MAKHLATLSSVNEGENNNSPYAQPLCMFQTNLPPTKILSKRKGNGKIRLTIITKKDNSDEINNDNTGVMPTGSSSTKVGVDVS